jgi:hypothetical protein
MFRYQLMRPTEPVKKGMTVGDIDLIDTVGLGTPAEVKAKLSAAFPAATWETTDSGRWIAEGVSKFIFNAEDDGQVRTVLMANPQRDELSLAARTLKAVVVDSESEDMELMVF